MDLYEYQGRELFARHGLPVLDGGVATTPEEARAIADRLGGRVVVKAQVKVGGRGKAGGVKLADGVDEAEARARDILGMDVSYRALEIAQDKLRLDRLPPMQRERIRLIHGSLIYRDKRLEGYEAAAVVEVIEHLDPPRLAAFERAVFDFARPGTVVITTPNVEYNPKFETLPAGRFRHKDHRFEWTRAEFQSWAGRIGERFGYAARFLPLGPEDAEVGAPSQMAIFERVSPSSQAVPQEGVNGSI